jgi:hypothetical protein
MLKSAPAHFKCPRCDALYQRVKVEIEPKISLKQRAGLRRRVCGGELPARGEGLFILKYFLLWKATRRRPYARSLD